MVSLAQIITNAMPIPPTLGARVILGPLHMADDEDYAPVEVVPLVRPEGLTDRAWLLMVLRGSDLPMCSRDFLIAGLDQRTASAILCWARSEKLVDWVCDVDRHEPGGRPLRYYVAKQ